MALLEVRRLWEETADNTGEERAYLVEYNTAAEFTLWDARTANDGTTAIPADGDALTPGSNIKCVSKKARRLKEAPQCARVDVIFAVPGVGVVGGGGGGDDEDRWNFSITSSGVSFVESVTEERYGLPVANSAGQPFDPGLVKEYYDELITVSFTTNNLDPDEIAYCRGKVNSDSITMTVKGVTRTFNANELKLGNAEWSFTTGDGAADVVRVTLPFIYRVDGWKRRVPDMGYYTLGDANALDPILDAGGDKVVQPSYLDGAGQLNPFGEPVVLLEFDIDDETEFSTLLAGLT